MDSLNMLQDEYKLINTQKQMSMNGISAPHPSICIHTSTNSHEATMKKLQTKAAKIEYLCQLIHTLSIGWEKIHMWRTQMAQRKQWNWNQNQKPEQNPFNDHKKRMKKQRRWQLPAGCGGAESNRGGGMQPHLVPRLAPPPCCGPWSPSPGP